MIRLVSFLIFTFFFLNPAFSYVDLSLNLSYNQQIIEGESTSGEAVSETKTIGAAWAWYLWEYTALEFSYSRSDNNVTDTRPIQDSGGALLIKEVRSNVITDVLGVGLRQSFANRKSRIVPSFGIGYARVSEEGKTTYIVNTGGVDQALEQEDDAEVYDSSYLSLGLRIRITELMGFRLGAKSIMPNFDTSKASQNITYHLGFSWLF